jgi:AcrR family transcriptional regulator
VPRAEPYQHRARQTRERILAAAREVLEEKGREHFTTKDVAARSGSSIGTVYRYFGDRGDILDVIAPDRDLVLTTELLGKIEAYVQKHGALPPGRLREVVNFIQEATL